MLYYTQQTNHKNLWKSAYKKYTEDDSSEPKVSSTATSSKASENMSSNLIPHELVLREAIMRMYGCNIVHYKLDKLRPEQGLDDAAPLRSDLEIQNVNHYPFLAAIESNTHFYLFHHPVIENSLHDCVTYSPSILDKTYNKPLFIIYQLLNVLKSIHEKGLLLGAIGSCDIYLSENLIIHVIPKIEANLIHFEETANESIESDTRMSLISNPEHSLKDYCQMWCTGQMSNFDYLTVLNNYAGRRIDSADYHHIVPWVIDFSSKSGNWRDLTKTKYRLTKGDAQLDITYQHIKHSSENTSSPHHVSDVLSEITFYVYMARKTQKSVLCRHVRSKFVAAEYPASIQRLCAWTPDGKKFLICLLLKTPLTFNISECIPEFFTDPSVFKSIHEDLADLEVPSWSSSPEVFIAKHREALESQYVSENLHHWIDLTFGYKLSGKAAVKAKNVVLTLVDEHQTITQRGVVQLFSSHHPPRQFKNPWFSKMPPRINSSEVRKRLTRSSEDLSMENYYQLDVATATPPRTSSPRGSARLPHQSESIERSPSYHISPRTSQHVITLPPNYNPLYQLKSVEVMGNFISKTFHETPTKKTKSEKNLHAASLDYPLTASFQNYLTQNHEENAFTNMLFLETYEASLKDSKMYKNLKQRRQQALNSKKQFKQIVQEFKTRDLKAVGCIIIEIFMSKKLRSLTKFDSSFDDRFEACQKLLKSEENILPYCVQNAVKLLFGMLSDNSQITNLGLPNPNAQQLLQPVLANILIPFPDHFFKIYAAVKSVIQFNSAADMLEIFSFYDCDGKNCEKFEEQDRMRVGIQRKIAECKVKAFAALTEGLLEPSAFDQFNAVDIILPYVSDMFKNEETGILAAWYLFDNLSTAIGIEKTKKFLLSPMLGLYDVHNDERVNFLNSNFEASIRITASSFRSKKAVKLYHHSFLLRLIVRFGLKCFLDNFISILIEAAGGSKDPEIEFPYHLHDSAPNDNQTAPKDFGYSEHSMTEEDSPTLVSPGSNESDDKTMSSKVVVDEMFEFDNDEAQSAEAESAFAKIIDHFDIKSETSSIDFKFNHSEADEANENENLEDKARLFIEPGSLKSPTIPIPASVYKRGIAVASIGCEIGSRKSNDSFDLLSKTSFDRDDSVKSKSESQRDKSESKKSRSRTSRSTRISEMSAESLLWLAHRLGPVLTARYLTKNLLKMLTLCYVSQENLLPSTASKQYESLALFSISESVVVGDENAQKVLDCLTSISALFGEHFILHQYLPHVCELIGLCKKKVTVTLEGGLISSIQLIKYIIPCLSDVTIMEQLQDVILKNIVKPAIRLLNSTHFVMPSGFLGRGVLARKLIDLMYILSVRIGSEIASEYLCVPHLQRFFLIFDKAYGIEDPDDSKAEDCHEKGLDEIKESFTPSLAHAAYLTFAKQLGEKVMKQTVKNLELILNLSHEYEAPNYQDYKSLKTLEDPSRLTNDQVDSPHSFGTNVSIVGNRLDFQTSDGPMSEQTNLIDLVAYKMQNVSSHRQLKGNWLAYWTSEIGRSDKDQHFNLKQIRLQTFSGHTNSIRGILCLDNENSFMSASKDKTVKLWSLRNEGDGSKISSCQFTYMGHKKSVHSIAFLDSMRITVSCDGGVHLWDPFVGAVVNQIEGLRFTPVSIVRTYPTPSNLILAGTADTTIKAIDSRICDYILEWKLTTTPAGSVRCLTISPSAKWIAVGLPAGQITLLDARTGMILSSWKASDGELLQMQAPSDNELIVSSLDNSVTAWNISSGTLLYSLKSVLKLSKFILFLNLVFFTELLPNPSIVSV